MNDKHLFHPQDSEPQPEKLKTKREFHPTQVELDQSAYQEEGEMEQQLQQAIQRPAFLVAKRINWHCCPVWRSNHCAGNSVVGRCLAAAPMD